MLSFPGFADMPSLFSLSLPPSSGSFIGLSPFPGLPLTSILILSPDDLTQSHDMNFFYYSVLGPLGTPELLILKGDPGSLLSMDASLFAPKTVNNFR